MFKSVLVANRGEIACRIFRSARAMGLRTVAVYSDADAKGKHVREADEAVHIGLAPAAESYLRGDKIISAALGTGAEAIHPGYGFLSESPGFAEAVIDAGLIWIGPTPAAVRAMGLKDEAKRIAEEAGVPVVPGYRGADQDAKALKGAAREIGYPVLIKAVAGGGGRGIREVNSAGEFADALASAKREALAAFGDERVIIEKLIERPRHIEVQVFGDKFGNLVHMYERDCSLQRRRQKVIEEAPAPGMTDEVRAAMTDAALKVARAVAYENAGTVEFIVDGSGSLRPDAFWFLEMNTRLQVEHPVTEAVTGLDLVEWQFRIAAGEKLPLEQQQITLTGHAIEARICAEDPSEGFRPSVGRIELFDWTNVLDSTRMDSGFDAIDVVPPSYDSLIAKVIVKALDRCEAVRRLTASVDYTYVRGVRTNGSFLFRCLFLEEFKAGRHHVGSIGENLDRLSDRSVSRERIGAAAACIDLERRWHEDPWAFADGWRANTEPVLNWQFSIDGERSKVVLRAIGDEAFLMSDGVLLTDIIGLQPLDSSELGDISFHLGGRKSNNEYAQHGGSLFIFGEGDCFEVTPTGALRDLADSAASDEVKAPLPGKIVALTARNGQNVKKGDPLLTLEAMKMEHTLKAPRDGVIAEIAVETGAQVKEGAVLVRLEAIAE